MHEAMTDGDTWIKAMTGSGELRSIGLQPN